MILAIEVFRLGRLGDPGVSPPPGQGRFVGVTASNWAGYQADLFGFTQLAPELGFLMVVNDNAITV